MKDILKTFHNVWNINHLTFLFLYQPKQGTAQANLTSTWQTNLQQQQDNVAQIGIAIEPVAELSQKTPLENTQASSLTTFAQFTQKMASNLFNYCSSFAISQSEMRPQPSETFVPLSAIQKWYQTFERRMTMDPNFWKDLWRDRCMT